MNRERLYAAVLQPLSQVGNNKVLAVPPQAGFHCHGDVNGLHYFRGDIEQ